MKVLITSAALTVLVAAFAADLAMAQQRRLRTDGRRALPNQTQEASTASSSRDLPKVDLTVTAITGRDNNLMVTVKNLGFQQSPAAQLQVVVKDRLTGQTRTTKMANVQRLQSGGVQRVRLAAMAIGNSQVFATVDPRGQITESNERNNSKAATIDAGSGAPPPRQRPDLHFTGVQPKGNLLSVSLTNMGKTRSKGTLLNIVIRGRDGRLRDTKSMNVRPLNAGETTRMTVRNVLLSDVRVILTVDPENLVAESNERNNTTAINVDNQTEYAPDLKITDIMFKPQQKEVWFQVRNVGPVAQNQDVSLTVKAYFGPGNLVQRSALRVGSLNTGQHTWHRWSVNQLNTGMQFEGELDVGNRLPEQNENNNRRVETFNG